MHWFNYHLTFPHSHNILTALLSSLGQWSVIVISPVPQFLNSLASALYYVHLKISVLFAENSLHILPHYPMTRTNIVGGKYNHTDLLPLYLRTITQNESLMQHQQFWQVPLLYLLPYTRKLFSFVLKCHIILSLFSTDGNASDFIIKSH